MLQRAPCASTILPCIAVQLFERSRTGYTPTLAGEEAVTVAERMADDLIALETRLAGQDMRPSGAVRITTSDTLLIGFLTPILAELRRTFPQIAVDVVSSAAWLDLNRREADIAVRVCDSPPEHLVGRRIGAIETAVYASDQWLNENPWDGILAKAAWIGYGTALRHFRAADWLEKNVAPANIIYRVDTVLGARDAALLNMGVAILPDIAADGLCRLDPSPMPAFQTDLWLLTHPQLRSTARVRAVMDALATAIPKRLHRKSTEKA